MKPLSRSPRFAMPAAALVAAACASVCLSVPLSSQFSGTATAADTSAASAADAAIYNEFQSIALSTKGESRNGYAVRHTITETYVGRGGPWLTVRTNHAVREATESQPKVAYERTVDIAPELADQVPYTNLTWGGVGTGGWGTGGITQGWEMLPTAETGNKATEELLARYGNPTRVVGRVGASADASPASRPYSLLETHEWAEHNGLTPWGAALARAQDNDLTLASATKKTDKGVATYTFEFTHFFDGTVTIVGLVQDDLLVSTTVIARFPPYGPGEPRVEVQTLSELTFIGRRAPMPGPVLDDSIVRASTLAKDSARDLANRIAEKAEREVREALGEEPLTLSNMKTAVAGLQNEDPRWYMPSRDSINAWVDSANLTAIDVGLEIVTGSHVMTVPYSCSLILGVESGSIVPEMICQYGSIPVLGIEEVLPPSTEDPVVPPGEELRSLDLMTPDSERVGQAIE